MRTTPLTLVVTLVVLLLLAACSRGPVTPVYHQGSQGLVLSFEEGTPPEQVYEDTDVPVILRVWNKGAHDVAYGHIYASLKADTFYATVEQDPLFSADVKQPDQVLAGKGPGWNAGEWLDLRPTVHFKPILGARESPSTQLYASVCYPYETVLGTNVCVDANGFNGNVQRQVCAAQTLAFSDQGAPVAITSVENRPTPLRVSAEGGRGYSDIVQPMLIIHVRNVGDGSVLRSATDDPKALAAACSLASTDGADTVSIQAELSGLNLTCSPDPIPLRDDEGFTTCVLDPGSVKIDAPNYLATLRITLGYVYRAGTAVEVGIIRRPGVLNDRTTATYPERDKDPGYVNGEVRCAYCSRSPDDPACSDMPAAAKALAKAGSVFTCGCSAQECLTLAPDGKCVYGNSWCPGTNQCCTK